jgi:hypothetical protein
LRQLLQRKAEAKPVQDNVSAIADSKTRAQ